MHNNLNGLEKYLENSLNMYISNNVRNVSALQVWHYFLEVPLLSSPCKAYVAVFFSTVALLSLFTVGAEYKHLW